MTRLNQVFDPLPPRLQAAFERAHALQQRGQFGQARTLYKEILKVRPAHFDSLHMLGVIAIQTGMPDLGARIIGDAIRLGPNVPPAHYNRGNALMSLGRLAEALEDYDAALALKPDYAAAGNNRGVILQRLNRPLEALASFDAALAASPGFADAHNNRAVALKHLGRTEDAASGFRTAISLRPDFAEAHYNLGQALESLNRLDEAVDCYERALALKPDYEFLFGTLLHARMRLCRWDGLAGSLARLETDIAQGKRVAAPFPLLSLLDVPRIHLAAARLYTQARHPSRPLPGRAAPCVPGKRIRIGYYSADFHNHATAYLMAELFEAHDKERFELYAFSFGPDRDDEMRRRVAAAFTRFIDVRDAGDGDLARMSREIGIDIAVDLKGYTQHQRAGIFAERAAPVQVSYLGYPGTMGADFMDYILADDVVIPEAARADYAEKVVWLPGCYQVNDSRRRISDRVFSRAECGLPEQGFVFCCFNNCSKILPATFDGWMRVLAATEGSVLWLFGENPSAVANLRREARARGVDADRLVFAQPLPLEDHLARHRLAELFLDTLPYNAHTTASDALWAGLPVLTCAGRSFASRVAASLLQALEMPDLIAATQDEYEHKAIALAASPTALRDIAARLARRRPDSPLFDGRLFARRIEAAYEAMHARHRAGLAPDALRLA